MCVCACVRVCVHVYVCVLRVSLCACACVRNMCVLCLYVHVRACARGCMRVCVYTDVVLMNLLFCLSSKRFCSPRYRRDGDYCYKSKLSCGHVTTADGLANVLLVIGFCHDGHL